MTDDSLATGQRSLGDPDLTYPLEPPLTRGCPETSAESVRYPLEVVYDYGAVDPALFEGPTAPGQERWAPLLPPLAGESLGEGDTPLVATPELADWAGTDAAVYVKDESRNPTWSQKDRLNRLTVSAAVRAGADGVVASSSGNHGAAAAAYAARAGLPCVVFTKPETPRSMQGFLRAYGAAVLRVEGWGNRADLVDELAERGFHPVTSRTRTHTGHPWGPEGYKPIAYETVLQLGAAPGTVFVPTAHAELLFGAWKGFRELRELGVVDETPRMVACEPAARAPLAAAREQGASLVEVAAEATDAHSIAATENTHRGVVALAESDGFASPAADETIAAAQDRLAAAGLWQEFSGAAGVAGLRAAVEAGRDFEGPVVCLGTSSGFKDGGDWEAPAAEPSVAAIEARLASVYDLAIGD
jgi:threonine synthase